MTRLSVMVVFASLIGCVQNDGEVATGTQQESLSRVEVFLDDFLDGGSCTGVVCNQAFQAAIDQVAAAGGGTVRLSANKTYTLAPNNVDPAHPVDGRYAVEPRSNVNIVGAGMYSSVIKLADDATMQGTINPNLFWVYNQPLSDVTFEDFGVDLNGANNQPFARPCNCSEEFAIKSISFFSAEYDQDNGLARSQRIKFLALNVFNASGSNPILISHGTTSGTLSDDIQVLGSRFSEMGMDVTNPVCDHSTVNLFATNVTVTGNVFENAPGRPLWYSSACELHGSDSTFSNNLVRNYAIGVYLGGNHAAIATNLRASGNTMTGLARGAVFVEQEGTEPLGEVFIEDNPLFEFTLTDTDGNPRQALRLFSDTSVALVRFERNTVRRPNGPSGTRVSGIDIPFAGVHAPYNGVIGYLAVNDNTFENVGPVAQIVRDSSDVQHSIVQQMTVEGNVIRDVSEKTGGNNTTGIYVKGYDDYPDASVTIQNNTFTLSNPCDASACDAGVYDTGVPLHWVWLDTNLQGIAMDANVYPDELFPFGSAFAHKVQWPAQTDWDAGAIVRQTDTVSSSRFPKTHQCIRFGLPLDLHVYDAAQYAMTNHGTLMLRATGTNTGLVPHTLKLKLGDWSEQLTPSAWSWNGDWQVDVTVTNASCEAAPTVTSVLTYNRTTYTKTWSPSSVPPSTTLTCNAFRIGLQGGCTGTFGSVGQSTSKIDITL